MQLLKSGNSKFMHVEETAITDYAKLKKQTLKQYACYNFIFIKNHKIQKEV